MGAFVCAFLSADWVNENRIVITGTILVEIKRANKKLLHRNYVEPQKADLSELISEVFTEIVFYVVFSARSKMVGSTEIYVPNALNPNNPMI
ncbi:hypothetical protein [Treponema sp. Marseille-Q3903]|uniref:hypothetical protein n=1 Tax=Treponema sp. Marseille-Q3903 TaxID=2766703 RepID=UPI0016520BBE|nr:hypothetical protein [Treponema sp. Marseille-Q3903]MBC6714263.1 hypothetical protein [Treponema sp. Marseille-Q3903]